MILMWFGDCHVLGDEFDLEPVVRDVTYGNDWEDSFGTFLRDDMSPFFFSLSGWFTSLSIGDFRFG